MRKAFFFVMLATTICGTAVARTANDVTTTYFADAAKTKVVGFMELTCGGGVIRSGRTSRFTLKTTDSCSLHRVSSSALKQVAAGHGGLTRGQACHAMCYRKFGTPAYCLPDGSCPQRDALDECNQSCDAATNNQ